MSGSASTPISRTDWGKVAELSDAEIDTSDVPFLDGDYCARATVRMSDGPLAEVTRY